MESQVTIQRLNQIIQDREDELSRDHIRAEFQNLEKKLFRIRKEYEQVCVHKTSFNRQ